MVPKTVNIELSESIEIKQIKLSSMARITAPPLEEARYYEQTVTSAVVHCVRVPLTSTTMAAFAMYGSVVGIGL